MKNMMHKKSMSTALGLTLLMGLSVLSHSAKAEVQNGAVTFSTKLHIVSDNKCIFNVSPPASTAFTAMWKKRENNAVEWPGVSDGTGSYVKVSVSGSPYCTVNGLKIRSTVTDAVAIPNTGKAGGAVKFGTAGGYWVVVPEVSDVQYYTDADFEVPGSATVTGHTETSSLSVNYGDSINNGTNMVDAKDIGQGSTVGKTASSGASSISSALITNVIQGDTTSFTTNSSEKYKSAKFGISVIWGGNPIDENGNAAFDRALDGDTVDATFTMTVVQP